MGSVAPLGAEAGVLDPARLGVEDARHRRAFGEEYVPTAAVGMRASKARHERLRARSTGASANRRGSEQGKAKSGRPAHPRSRTTRPHTPERMVSAAVPSTCDRVGSHRSLRTSGSLVVPLRSPRDQTTLRHAQDLRRAGPPGRRAERARGGPAHPGYPDQRAARVRDHRAVPRSGRAARRLSEPRRRSATSGARLRRGRGWRSRDRPAA